MPVIGIEFECDEEQAKERTEQVEEALDDITKAEITDNGNFYREGNVGEADFNRILQLAENDPEATVKKTKI